MNFGRPELLVLLALVPLTAALVIVAHRRRARVLGALLSASALADLVPVGALRARAAQAVLAVVAALGLAFAAARPQLGFEWVQRKAQGVNLVVVLDVSRSMDAEDVSPSRMEQARRELIDLLGILRGDSVGLVLVANGAYLRLPLTTDYGTFLWVLQDTTTQTIAAQGTAMAGGLDTATQMLTRAGGAGKAIIVVSDGEFHDDEAAIAASLERVRAADIRVYSIGVGNEEGAPIPLSEGGFKKDTRGDMVLSKLNEAQLRAIALSTGGAYVRAVAGDDDVRGIYEGEIRAKLQAQEREVRREQIPHEQYQWPLSLALVALVGSAALGIGPGRRKARAKAALAARAGAALFGLGLLGAFPSAAWAGAREEGLEAAKKEEWATAIDRLGQARVDDPADVEVGQALGESLYRAGRYRESEQVFSAMAAADTAHRASHQYNAGNAAYRDGRLEQALNQFEASKAADPKFPSASKNAEAVRKEISLREQKEQEQQQQEGREGEPQEGQQGQPQEGQQGEAQEGQQGEPQEGQQGEPQEGQQGEAQEGQQGEPKEGEQGEPKQGEQGEAAQGQEGDPEQTGAASEVEAGEGAGGEKMTAAEAARLVDGVKDGRPHVSVGGRDTEKDW
ncbi:hypothetical protein LBMAG42_13200 [Deltaproteobacteria bacterium]|nr:hypothetical protein LBMAG42_13200 [Deltaproteobacteria bacterium]